MQHPIPAPPFKAKIYRHLAVIALTITAGVAMFVSNEKREPVEDHIIEDHEVSEEATQVRSSNFNAHLTGMSEIDSATKGVAFRSGDPNTIGSVDPIPEADSQLDGATYDLAQTTTTQEPRAIATSKAELRTPGS